jgi:hypothetical protein
MTSVMYLKKTQISFSRKIRMKQAYSRMDILQLDDLYWRDVHQWIVPVGQRDTCSLSALMCKFGPLIKPQP